MWFRLMWFQLGKSVLKILHLITLNNNSSYQIRSDLSDAYSVGLYSCAGATVRAGSREQGPQGEQGPQWEQGAGAPVRAGIRGPVRAGSRGPGEKKEQGPQGEQEAGAPAGAGSSGHSQSSEAGSL